MVFENLCFFAIDQSKGINYEGGGINSQTHNGYVRDCTSLGPDVVPESGPRAAMLPKAATAAKGVPSGLGAAKGKKTSALSTVGAGKSGFYASMM
mmetsp:Transcript_8552/g.20207  ORF Transcript_8552/g.20207 Transcript_8552/m.20207 type:complete len:95 (-) Transcript_8552:85-369(-)